MCSDIQRRSLEYEERNYLVETGHVTETQSNLGLLAVKSDDVLVIMQEEYPTKYKVGCLFMHVYVLGMQQYGSLPYCILPLSVLQYIAVLQYMKKEHISLKFVFSSKG